MARSTAMLICTTRGLPFDPKAARTARRRNARRQRLTDIIDVGIQHEEALRRAAEGREARRTSEVRKARRRSNTRPFKREGKRNRVVAIIR
jgi:hypothetical protein